MRIIFIPLIRIIWTLFSLLVGAAQIIVSLFWNFNLGLENNTIFGKYIAVWGSENHYFKTYIHYIWSDIDHNPINEL